MVAGDTPAGTVPLMREGVFYAGSGFCAAKTRKCTKRAGPRCRTSKVLTGSNSLKSGISTIPQSFGIRDPAARTPSNTVLQGGSSRSPALGSARRRGRSHDRRRRLGAERDVEENRAGRHRSRAAPRLSNEDAHTLIARARESQTAGLVANQTADLGWAQISVRQPLDECH